MKIGVTIPNHFGVADVSEVVRLGVLAEELNYDSVWGMDHFFNLGYIEERLGDAPYYHPLGVLSYLAARTSSIALGTSVIVLPYHSPIELAKYVATLDQLSGGRVILGVGAGGMEEEFAALGVPLAQRASLTNESIRIMKALWTQERASYSSPRWQLKAVRFFPKPRQQPHVPIWVGGASVGAKRRAALLGDGWHPNAITPEEFRGGSAEVRKMAAEAGRDPSSLVMSARVAVAMGPPTTERAASRSRLSGEPKQAIEVLRELQDAGCEHACLAFDSGDVAALEAAMRLFASEVVPAL
jgi:probable F420-dependent oxidoreductase